MKESVHSHTENIVCPHCDYVHHESYEFSDDSGTWSCDSCGEPFEYDRIIEVTYSTYLPSCTEDQHDWVLEYAGRNEREYVGGGVWNTKPIEEQKPYLRYVCSKCNETKYEHNVSEEIYESCLIELLKKTGQEKIYIYKNRDNHFHSSLLEITQNMFNSFEHEFYSDGNSGWMKII